MKAALLVVDMQKAFFEMESCRPSLIAALEYANATAELFRRSHRPVFMIQDSEAGNGPGSSGNKLYRGIVQSRLDRRVMKDHSNAFWKTSLEKDLKASGSDFIVVSGFAAAGFVAEVVTAPCANSSIH